MEKLIPSLLLIAINHHHSPSCENIFVQFFVVAKLQPFSESSLENSLALEKVEVKGGNDLIC